PLVAALARVGSSSPDAAAVNPNAPAPRIRVRRVIEAYSLSSVSCRGVIPGSFSCPVLPGTGAAARLSPFMSAVENFVLFCEIVSLHLAHPARRIGQNGLMRPLPVQW